MPRQEDNSASVAQRRNALLADTTTHRRTGIKQLSSQALNGNHVALVSLLEFARNNDGEACGFFEEGVRQQDVTVLAFLIRCALRHDRTAYLFLARYACTGNDIALTFLLERVYGGHNIARKFFEDRIQEEDNKQVASQDALVLSFLIARLQEHDPMAYELLYCYYTPITWRYMVYAKSIEKETAHDLTQQVFEKVWTAVSTTDIRLREKQNFKGWVARIRENKIKDYLDHLQPKTVSLSLEELIEPVAGDFQREADRRLDVSQSLQRSLDALPPQYREALHKEVFEKGSQAEKAQAMGIKESTFSSYVARARKELRTRYEQGLGDKSEMKTGGQVYE